MCQCNYSRLSKCTLMCNLKWIQKEIKMIFIRQTETIYIERWKWGRTKWFKLSVKNEKKNGHYVKVKRRLFEMFKWVCEFILIEYIICLYYINMSTSVTYKESRDFSSNGKNFSLKGHFRYCKSENVECKQIYNKIMRLFETKYSWQSISAKRMSFSIAENFP